MTISGRGRTGQGDELVFVALGGLGEIGMNLYLYGYGPPDARKWLMVDLGDHLPRGRVRPRHRRRSCPTCAFIEENRGDLVGIVITHAHEDHIGAVIELWPRLEGARLRDAVHGRHAAGQARRVGRRAADPDQRRAARRPLQGSAPSTSSSSGSRIPFPRRARSRIRTPQGLVFHTGDWKFDATPVIGTPLDETRLKRLGDEGVLALDRSIPPTPCAKGARRPSSDVAKSLAEIIAKRQARVAVTMFCLQRGAHQGGGGGCTRRRPAGRGRRAGAASRDRGRRRDRLPAARLPLPRPGPVQSLPRRDIVLLCTGSQGEQRAALARIAEEEHPEISLDKGDLVIFSSRTIPGNEKAVGRIQNDLARAGCDILTDNEALVHVTGHPRRDELRRMYAGCAPRSPCRCTAKRGI